MSPARYEIGSRDMQHKEEGAYAGGIFQSGVMVIKFYDSRLDFSADRILPTVTRILSPLAKVEMS